MATPKRKIKDLTVTFISLVENPATGKGLLLRSGQGQPRTFSLVKTDDEQMRAYGIVYAPGEVDAHGDTTDAEVIRRAATKFMRDVHQHNVDVEHTFETEAAFVAESWLIRSGDPMFGQEPEGAWAVGIQVGDADLWKRLKRGELAGISLAGWGRAEELEPGTAPESYVTKQEAPGLFRQWWDNLTGKGDTVTDADVRRIVQEEMAKAAAVPQASPQTEATPAAAPPAVQAPADFEKRVQAEVELQVAKALRKGKEESGPAPSSPSFL